MSNNNAARRGQALGGENRSNEQPNDTSFGDRVQLPHACMIGSAWVTAAEWVEFPEPGWAFRLNELLEASRLGAKTVVLIEPGDVVSVHVTPLARILRKGLHVNREDGEIVVLWHVFWLSCNLSPLRKGAYNGR